MIECANTANAIGDLAGVVMRECEDLASTTLDQAAQKRLERVYELAQGVVELLGPPTGEGDIPVVQALSLGRFLSNHWRGAIPSYRGARISRGGAGLPEAYLLVTFLDGYEGGIDPEGRVST